MIETMKCLSVRQPWAWLIVHGHKDVENRTWDTNYRGPLLIHASQRIDERIIDEFRVDHNDIELPLGALVGCVQLYRITEIVSSLWHEHGQIGWYLRNAVVFENPIRYRGQLGLFDVPVSVVPELRAT